MATDEDYLAHPEEEDIGAWWKRQAAGAASGFANPLGISGAVLKQAAKVAPSVISPEKADQWDRETKENMSRARSAAGLGAGAPLAFAGGMGAGAYMGARYGVALPLWYLARHALPAVPVGTSAGWQAGRIWDDFAGDTGPPDAQARYRRGGY